MAVKVRYVDLDDLPTPKKEYVSALTDFSGGLNIRDLSYQLAADECPEMQNLYWKAGGLRSRDGQVYITRRDNAGPGITAYSKLYAGYMFVHCKNGLYYYDPTVSGGRMTKVYGDTTHNKRGTFFQYQDSLFYKTEGLFVQIDQTTSGFSAKLVEAYTPTIVMNGDPATGAGDAYQPENRYSAWKRITYTPTTVTATYKLPVDSIDNGEQARDIEVRADGAMKTYTDDYTLNTSTGVITFNAGRGPTNWSTLSVSIDGLVTTAYTVNQSALTITMTDTSILKPRKYVKVTVSGARKEEFTDYTVSASTGTITFVSGHEPAVVSTDTNYVAIEYRSTDEDAYDSIDDCRYAFVYGGTTGNCIVLGGCSAQKNAYFWNSNDSYDMNPGYWPYDTYQLAGANSEAVTGFGQQAGELIIFKENSIGKSAMGTQTINSRNYIDFPYSNVNRKIGCDLPWSIQLIQNNLVWCNTVGGVHYMSHTSPAYENNVLRMSLKVNGNSVRNGLLSHIRHAGVDEIISGDDGDRYWLLAGSRAYVWDYSLSEDSDPAWFFLKDIESAGFVSQEHSFWQLCKNGRLAEHKATYSDWTEKYSEILNYNNETTYTLVQNNDHSSPLRVVKLYAGGVTQEQGVDYTVNVSTGVVTFLKTYPFNTELRFALEYGDPISKRFVSATQILGGYDSLKDVTKVVFSFRADAPSTVSVAYRTDYADHVAIDPIKSDSWSWVPRDLTVRDLSVHSFATIAVRRNGCKNVRHLAIILSNNNYGEDLAVVSEYIYYKYKGRDR